MNIESAWVDWMEGTVNTCGKARPDNPEASQIRSIPYKRHLIPGENPDLLTAENQKLGRTQSMLK